MRKKLENYMGRDKVPFVGTVERFGCYIDKETGKQKHTVLITELYGLDNSNKPTVRCAEHVWIKKDKRVEKANLEVGETYVFTARVGTYKKNRTTKDFQLRDICNFKKINSAA